MCRTTRGKINKNEYSPSYCEPQSSFALDLLKLFYYFCYMLNKFWLFFMKTKLDQFPKSVNIILLLQSFRLPPDLLLFLIISFQNILWKMKFSTGTRMWCPKYSGPILVKHNLVLANSMWKLCYTALPFTPITSQIYEDIFITSWRKMNGFTYRRWSYSGDDERASLDLHWALCHKIYLKNIIYILWQRAQKLSKCLHEWRLEGTRITTLLPSPLQEILSSLPTETLCL